MGAWPAVSQGVALSTVGAGSRPLPWLPPAFGAQPATQEVSPLCLQKAEAERGIGEQRSAFFCVPVMGRE